MIHSIWRYSHLSLAISSCVFVLIAAITGIILAFEPIQEQMHDYDFELDDILISQTIATLQNEYDEVISLEKDRNNFINATVITKDGEDAQFYIDPKTGKKIGELLEKKPFFQWITNLHRSLFLKSVGRALVGIASFLLFLIAVTGTILILKRQGGMKASFGKVVKENNYQYFHVILGRLSLIPIVIITLTGVYLSLEKFSLLPKEDLNHITQIKDHSTKREVADFTVFNKTSLADLKSLEFPFSEDEEDYFYLKTNREEIVIHQYSGKIVSSAEFPLVALASDLSMILHTGQGSLLWSICLLISTLAIPYFMYSGFKISLERNRNKVAIPRNTVTANDAETLILVGTETGSTYKPAKALFLALLKDGQKVHISDLNEFEVYKNVKSIFILTSTYGKGDAPKNANRFLELVEKSTFNHPINFAVVGFGSLAYPDYCEFAIEIDHKLTNHKSFERLLPLKKIHNQSLVAFKDWTTSLAKRMNYSIVLDESLWKVDQKSLETFKVIDKSELNADNTFLLKLKSKKKSNVQSGDLLAFYPKNEVSPRYYSIAKIDNHILLSIKKHEFGKASNYLSELKIGDEIKAKIQINPDFHFPKHKQVILICNGTGIAPLLGMFHKNPKGTHLFWGGRTRDSFDIYKTLVRNALDAKQLQTHKNAYSREEEHCYVQDLLKSEQNIILDVIQNNGSIMICGSLKMEFGVRKVLKDIANKHGFDARTVNDLIQSDCY